MTNDLYAIQIAELFPPQGQWDEQDYLHLTDHTRRLVELVDGSVEVLEMPTESHQLMVQCLFLVFHSYLESRAVGTLVFAPIRVRTVEGRYREPDLALMLAEHSDRRSQAYWEGADLVVEVVSEDEQSRLRDLKVKREEYARAGVGEYWIVDPRDHRVTVLALEGKRFVELGSYQAGEYAESKLLPGLRVDVTSLWQAGRQ
jgi:Uma2 family endonuclease